MHASREKPASSRALSTPVGQTVRVRRGAAEASPFSQFAKELPPLTPPRPLYDQFYNGISAGQSPAAPAIGIPGVSCGEASTSRPEREVSPEDGQSSEHAGPRLGSPDRQPSVAFGEHCSYGSPGLPFDSKFETFGGSPAVPLFHPSPLRASRSPAKAGGFGFAFHPGFDFDPDSQLLRGDRLAHASSTAPTVADSTGEAEQGAHQPGEQRDAPLSASQSLSRPSLVPIHVTSAQAAEAGVNPADQAAEAAARSRECQPCGPSSTARLERRRCLDFNNSAVNQAELPATNSQAVAAGSHEATSLHLQGPQTDTAMPDAPDQPVPEQLDDKPEPVTAPHLPSFPFPELPSSVQFQPPAASQPSLEQPGPQAQAQQQQPSRTTLQLAQRRHPGASGSFAVPSSTAKQLRASSLGHLQTGITLAVPVEAAAALVASLAHTAATPVARRRSATSYSGHSIVTETSQQSVQMPETPGDAVKLGDRRDSTSATGGPKKCNCKKSKCLKLYCDCFAAGQYCTNCTCQNCCNTPDQKDIVDEMRDQIRSRNPHAFDEKIGKHYVAAGGAGQHKRGCNCKKSHCRKKYCECFQAGVNCGQHCKCEGCHNCVEHGPPPKPKEPKQKAVVEVAYHVAGVTKTSPGTPAVKAVPEAKPAERKLTRQRSKRGSVGSAGSAGRSQEDTAQEGSQPGSSAPSLLPYDTPGMVWPTSQLQQPAAHVLPTSEAAHAQDMPDAEPLPIQPLQTSRQVDVKVEPGLASQSTQMAISPQQPGMQASPCLPGDTLHTGLPPGSDHIPISSSQGMMMLPMLPSPSQGFGGGLPPAGPEMPAGPLPEQAEAYGAGAEAPPAYQVIYSQTADGQFVPVFATTGQVQQLQSGAVLVPQPGQTPGSAHLHLLTGGCQGTPSASLMLPLASPARLEASLQEADGPSAAFQLLAPSSAFFGDLMGQEFEITEVTDYAEARMVEVGLEGGDEMEIELEELMRGAPEFGDEGLAHLPFPLAMGAERGQWAGEEFENAPSAANTLHSGSPGTSTRLDRSFAGHKTGSPGTRSKAKRSIHLGSPLHSPRQENGVRRCTPTKRAARFGAYHTSALAASLAGDLASMHSGRGMSHVAPALAAGSGMDKPQLMTQHSAHFEGSGAQHAQHAVPSLGQAMDEDVFMAGAVQRGAELQRAATWEEGSTRLQHLGTGSTTIFSPNRK